MKWQWHGDCGAGHADKIQVEWFAFVCSLPWESQGGAPGAEARPGTRLITGGFSGEGGGAGLTLGLHELRGLFQP